MNLFSQTKDIIYQIWFLVNMSTFLKYQCLMPKTILLHMYIFWNLNMQLFHIIYVS